MITFEGKNVEEVFQIALMSLRNEKSTIKLESRVGDVLMFPDPVCSTYRYPRERVLFMPERNCNPFFHFIEGLWMLAGRDDLKAISWFVKRMEEFSDDGIILNGAYGNRWRSWFGFDQLKSIIQKLKDNPFDRRIVLSMWGASDLHYTGKDVPCNTQVYFKCRPGKELNIVDMTVMCRSNDMIWGAYGANAVHFSMLHEYVASMANLEVGKYHQISNNAHVYTDLWDDLKHKLPEGIIENEYTTDPNVKWQPLVEHAGNFDQDLKYFFNLLCDNPSGGLVGGQDITADLFSNSDTFAYTAIPMVQAWSLYKQKDTKNAIAQASTIQAPDWKKACVQWLERKVK